ncbi:hypothetical protein CA267_012650 [Alteromonas pelagimontana]|uniref:DUF2189 domain-containing protein n=1 Tax=Alteromonas pelagimontana TaxID=1858656 RepID=A0A6M4MEP1_9ALTE|nr:hypothetical protein [Alteromonas pelagimontana]QJR81559.1 hypothetical protein CA267_012650 [Alteromonas pelagimontana]
MHINTKLEKQDYINAYKNMFAFVVKRPVIMAFALMSCFLVTTIPFAMFPVKMAGFAALVALMVCLVTTHYRTGSLETLIQELQFQQRIYLPAIVAVASLSWLGFMVAEFIVSLLNENTVAAQSAIQASQAEPLYSTTLLAAVIAAALICVAQVMPFVLALFCHGLDISKGQGENIWWALITNLRTFAAFVPIAQLVPIAVVFSVDLTALIVLFGGMYSTFLLFIVFNIEPKTAEKASSLTLIEQL